MPRLRFLLLALSAIFLLSVPPAARAQQFLQFSACGASPRVLIPGSAATIGVDLNGSLCTGTVVNFPATAIGPGVSATAIRVTSANDDPLLLAVQGATPTGANTIGNVIPAAGASGTGASQFHLVALNTDNAQAVKAGAGTVYGVEVYGINAAPAYLKFYDKAAAPTCNADTVVKQIMIPAAATAANGAGANVTFPVGVNFGTGIAICVVTGIANNDDTAVTAANFVINIDYK